MRPNVSLIAALSFLVPSLLAAAEAPVSFLGSWDGVIQVSPAELEIEFSIDIQPGPDGHPTGRMTIPSQNVHAQPFESLTIDGRSIAFVFKDPHSVSNFSGELLQDGLTIDGRLVEGESTYPFLLEHRRSEHVNRPKPSLHTLSAGGQELRTMFDQDSGAVRLLLILSPSCSICREGARTVQRYVLNTIPDQRLRVYVVWEPVQKEDSEKLAMDSTEFLDDPRATHFWAPDRFAGTTFQKAVGLTKYPAWDVFLLFAPGKKWPANPDFFMHNLLGSSELSKDQRLNGTKLAEAVRGELTKTSAKSGATRP